MPIRVLFVNGGILGLLSFDLFLRQMLPTQSTIAGDHLVLSEGLTVGERVARRVLGLRLWRDGALGVANLDLARFRLELFAGLLARRRLAGRRYDVLHFHRQATAYGSLDLMARVPSIVSFDCTQECVAGPAGRLERATYAPNVRIDGAIFRRAAALVSTSRWAADSLRAAYPDCRTPIHVLPAPVLVDGFDAEWIERRRARALAGEAPRVLFVGGDFPRKGGDDLLDAWEAGAFHRRATLDLVTDWPIARRLPPGVAVHRGVHSYTPAWYARWEAADLFVLPTRNEAFGLVFQEAAAAGLPAVGTVHHAVPEIVSDGETGLLVPTRDVTALAAALDRLIGAPDLRDAYGRRARAVIGGVASPVRYLSQLTAIVRDVAKTR
jgi:glycosyltransferase involved in cell wall biosynthesis